MIFGPLFIEVPEYYYDISEKFSRAYLILMALGYVSYLRWHDKYSAKKLVPKIKNEYEPIVSETVSIQLSKIEEVYSKCVNWLNYRGTSIYEENYPYYILAFEAGSYSGNVDSDDSGIPSDVLKWAKFFQFKLTQMGPHVDVLFDIYQGWEKINIESYEKRKKEYPIIILEFKRYVVWGDKDIKY